MPFLTPFGAVWTGPDSPGRSQYYGGRGRMVHVSRIGGKMAKIQSKTAAPHRGANVENGSYGLTICAERVAIFAGVAAGGRRLVKVALTCRDREGTLVAKIAPCGACLQVIAEFGSAETAIEIDGRGTFRLADFLPRPFEAESLKG